MARSDIDRPVQQSLIDRLIDDDPFSNMEPPMSRSQSVRVYKNSIRRDLEWLLNSRRTPEEPPEDMENAAESVLYYGLPDVTSLSGDSTDDRVRLLRMIEDSIATYEPRLTSVSVSEAENPDSESRRVRFSIQATLRMDPSPELVYFDTILDLSSKEYEVKGS